MESFISGNLKTRFIGRRLFYYPSLSSTMEAAKEAAKKGVEEGAVVIAGEQVAGKGRLGRTWLSPKGSLAISIVLRPHLKHLPQLIMIASLAVVYAIKKVSGLQAQIKWPNDVLINGRKVCGILIENELVGTEVNFAIIGIGVNVNFAPSAFTEVSATATSLSYELGREVPHLGFVLVLLSEVERLYVEAQAGVPIYKDWRNHMETLGKWIQVKAGDTIEEGKAEATAEDGSLLLRRSDGSLATIVVGDVTVLKS